MAVLLKSVGRSSRKVRASRAMDVYTGVPPCHFKHSHVHLCACTSANHMAVEDQRHHVYLCACKLQLHVLWFLVCAPCVSLQITGAPQRARLMQIAWRHVVSSSHLAAPGPTAPSNTPRSSETGTRLLRPMRGLRICKLGISESRFLRNSLWA